MIAELNLVKSTAPFLYIISIKNICVILKIHIRIEAVQLFEDFNNAGILIRNSFYYFLLHSILRVVLYFIITNTVNL